jgi:transcriptional regulator with XRE-family HTH domain
MPRPIGISSLRKVDTVERAMGAVVAHYRIRNGFSQAILADKLCCDISYISQLERGLINPSLRRILDLASALGMEAGKLVRKVNDEFEKSGSKH